MKNDLLSINRTYILNDKVGNNDSDLFDFYDFGKTTINDLYYYKSELKVNEIFEYKKHYVKYRHTNVTLDEAKNNTRIRGTPFIPGTYQTDQAHLLDMDNEELVFSEHIVWAPTNTLKKLPVVIIFHGGGFGTGAWNFNNIEKRYRNIWDGTKDSLGNNLLDNYINSQYDNTPPIKTFSEIFGCIAIYMNGFFGKDTNKESDTAPRKYRSPPWWDFKSSDNSGGYDIKSDDLWNMLDYIDTNICKIDKENICTVGYSIGGSALLQIMDHLSNVLYSRYWISSIIATFPVYLGNQFMSIKNYGDNYYKYKQKNVHYLLDIGSDDSIYGGVLFRYVINNFDPDNNPDRINNYSANQFINFDENRIFNKDTIKNDIFQVHFYKTKFKNNAHVDVSILYNLGGDHLFAAKDEQSTEIVNQWSEFVNNYSFVVIKDYYTFCKYYKFVQTKSLLL